MDEEKKEIFPGYESVENFTKDGFKALMDGIRHSNALPTGRDWNFYTTHQSFNKIMTDEGNKILSLMNSILRKCEIDGNIRNRHAEEKTELVVEANDTILEKVANNIDEMNGIKKCVNEPVVIQTVSAQLPVNGSWNRIKNATFSVSSSIGGADVANDTDARSVRLLTAKNILRPQKFFKDKIDNSRQYPWEPRIKDKPNSLKPLAVFLEETENGEEFSHPYEYELDRFSPNDEQLSREVVAKPKTVEDTPLVEIESVDQLSELVEALRGCKEFAVDLEHHSYRSFMGITCLMQISTRDTDYIIDTLTLRDKLHVLNEVFTKKDIVKIFHGADMDIQWLQRDLSLYVVNMFDTHLAAKQLEYSGLSLAYLMQRFCNLIPNKQFQLADWRIRPLPEELKRYAREDTHYLIYIYQMMKNELLQKAHGNTNVLKSVWQRSTDLCKKRYLKPVFRDDSYLDFYRRCKRLFDNRQLYALKELYDWRDQISRDEDESTGFVLPNHMLLQISETLPREMQGILACCNPIPTLVRSNLLDLHKIILKAREQPLEKAILKEDTRARGATTKISKVNVDSPLNCPHDLTKTHEFRDDLKTLLTNHEDNDALKYLKSELKVENFSSQFTIFTSNTDKKTRKFHNFSFLSPFERYKLVKPFVQAEEEKKSKNEEEVIKENVISTSSGDNRTDEERIDSIKQHFLHLSKQTASSTPQETNLDVSLLDMGGQKKKRKRNDLEEEEEPRINPYYEVPSNDLHTSIPNLHENYDNLNNRKRKSNDNLHLQKNKQRRRTNRGDKHQHNPPDGNNDETYRKGRLGYDNNDNSRPEVSHKQHQNRNARNQRGRNRGNGGGHGRGQPREEFAAYDYSSVDFRQFQGGGRGVEERKQFRSNFKARGKKKGGNRGQNKSFTYGKKRGQ